MLCIQVSYEMSLRLDQVSRRDCKTMFRVIQSMIRLRVSWKHDSEVHKRKQSHRRSLNRETLKIRTTEINKQTIEAILQALPMSKDLDVSKKIFRTVVYSFCTNLKHLKKIDLIILTWILAIFSKNICFVIFWSNCPVLCPRRSELLCFSSLAVR